MVSPRYTKKSAFSARTASRAAKVFPKTEKRPSESAGVGEADIRRHKGQRGRLEGAYFTHRAVVAPAVVIEVIGPQRCHQHFDGEILRGGGKGGAAHRVGAEVRIRRHFQHQ